MVPINYMARTWVRMNISVGANKFNIEHRGVIAVVEYPTLGEDPLLRSFCRTCKVPKMADTT